MIKRTVLYLFTLLVSAAFSFPLEAQQVAGGLSVPPFEPVPVRSTQYPLKTRRMLFDSSDIARAKNNMNRFPAARAVADRITTRADAWLRWSDDSLRQLLSDARVPRAFDLNPKGCPVHGSEVFKTAGTYPWIVDPQQPFKVKCPVGGEIYPGNDYSRYYQSDFTDTSDRSRPCYDDGWGWVAPDGERYWFVAYANHWLWMNFINPAILDLARAYLLTSNRNYAHKASLMLYRLAEVYPSMNHCVQSRYGLILRASGQVYNGKIFNLIWETAFIRNMAEAYDLVWDSIDGDTALQAFYGKSGEKIRGFIEANLLEDAIDAYMNYKIQGNYGMHQAALLHVLLARQHPESGRYIRMMMDENRQGKLQEGIRFALYNLVFRDGIPYESPGYNQSMVDRMAELGHLLERQGIDLWKEPRVRALLEGPLKLVVNGKFTPDIGDSGSLRGGIVGRNDKVYALAAAHYGNPDFNDWIAGTGKTGNHSFSEFESLFRDVLPRHSPLPDGRALRPRSSRLLAGYGLGILNDSPDKAGLSLNYGYKGAHYHWDFLNLDLYANGQKLTPDFGYPDAMNVYVKEVYAWSKNTAAHNTVVIDAKCQDINLPGTLHEFSEGSFARVIDASAPAYKHAGLYRRKVLMIDAGPDRRYFLDVFFVGGGRQHDYLLHGPPGTDSLLSDTRITPLKGTFAGPDVAYGYLYDAPELERPGYQGPYNSYNGSGYQYLFNPAALSPGKPVLEFRPHVSAQNVLRMHALTEGPVRNFLASAYDKPRARTDSVRYFISRKTAQPGDSVLSGAFCHLFESFREGAFITGIRPLQVSGGMAFEIRRGTWRDVVVCDTLQRRKKIAGLRLETDAATAVVTFDGENNLKRIFFSGGNYLAVSGKKFRAKGVSGTVKEAGYTTGELRVSGTGIRAVAMQPGDTKVAFFRNPVRSSAHPVAAAGSNASELLFRSCDDLLTGYIKVRAAENNRLTADGGLALAPLYRGAYVLDTSFRPLSAIRHAGQNGILELEKTQPAVPVPSRLWIGDIAPGDKFTIPPVFSREFK